MLQILIIGTVGFHTYIAWNWFVQYARNANSYERYVDAYVDTVYSEIDDDDDDDDDFDFDFRSI